MFDLVLYVKHIRNRNPRSEAGFVLGSLSCSSNVREYFLIARYLLHVSVDLHIGGRLESSAWSVASAVAAAK